MNSERKCPVCFESFIWSDKRKRQKITCSRNCSNSFFKRRIPIIPTKYKCLVCRKESTRRYGKAKNKYCSMICYRKDKIKQFEYGEIKERKTLRKIISEKNGYKCNICGLSEWNKKSITLQVNHIDGNCTNNLPKNLELICPNCHSQTSTFGARNKGNGRQSRGLPRHY